MCNIAIQGHPTRGKDVIKILESLGGNNKLDLKGNQSTGYYYLNNDNIIICEFHSCIIGKYTCYTLEKYEQKFNNMEKRNIQIDLTTAKEWYKQGGDLRKIALQAFTEQELQKLPKSWEEYCEINHYLDENKEVLLLASGEVLPISYKATIRRENPGAIPSKERAEKFIVLNKLLQIRDYYNQGWEPDWNDYIEDKYCITIHKNNVINIKSWHSGYIFAFKTKELRDEFYTNFKEDLEFIKEFL